MDGIGIRREDKNQWERRAPLTPANVKRLTAAGLGVSIQPSEIRVFAEEEYEEAGASVVEDLSDCKLVLGIKEFPLSFFIRGQAYAFFSHVIKGQPDNMPMLQAILDSSCTLIDYEKVTDDEMARLLYFGNYAGLAGMIEVLYAFGRRLASEGMETPFGAIKRPLDYGSLAEAEAALAVVGKWIETEGLPSQVVPVVVGFAGYGNVSKGAQGILDNLPVTEVRPEDLAVFMASGEHRPDTLYKVEFHERHMVEAVNRDQLFDLHDYYASPEKYRGVFDQYLAHLSMLVNGIYWDERYPRLLTKRWLAQNWSREARLKVIGDISCDVGGSVECNVGATDPGNPVYTYLPASDEAVDGYEGEGPVVMAIDTLPSELPRESSIFFGNLLMPFVPLLAGADYDAPFEALPLPPEIKRAVIAHAGELTPDYDYLSEYL